MLPSPSTKVLSAYYYIYKKMDGRARVQSQPELNGEFTPNLGITFKLTVAVIKHLSKASSVCLLIEPRGVLTHSGLSPPPLITN